MPTMPKFEDYPFQITPLTEEDGGGFLITFPDLPGCMSDGETYAEAIENGRDAFKAWMGAYIEDGNDIPKPSGVALPHFGPDHKKGGPA